MQLHKQTINFCFEDRGWVRGGGGIGKQCHIMNSGCGEWKTIAKKKIRETK